MCERLGEPNPDPSLKGRGKAEREKAWSLKAGP